MRLDSGESGELTQPLTDETLAYMGSPDPSDSTPTYSSTIYITNGDDLTVAIGKLDAALALIIPVGTYIAFDDFNATLSFPDNNYWQICDGSVIADLDSPINGQTIKDMSGRYLVGYGTDGGADIGGAGAMALAGNASHQINISHTHTGPNHSHAGGSHAHTGPNHSHAGGSHTHTGPNHAHGAGSLVARVFMNNPETDPTDGIYLQSTSATAWNASYRDDSGGNKSVVPTGITNATVVAGSTAAAGTGATGAGSATTGAGGTGSTGAGSAATGMGGTGATGAAGSATQSIQPRSAQVRMFIRYK